MPGSIGGPEPRVICFRGNIYNVMETVAWAFQLSPNFIPCFRFLRSGVTSHPWQCRPDRDFSVSGHGTWTITSLAKLPKGGPTSLTIIHGRIGNSPRQYFLFFVITLTRSSSSVVTQQSVTLYSLIFLLHVPICRKSPLQVWGKDSQHNNVCL